MSITDHAQWKLVRKYMYLEPCKDGDSKNSRNRIEFKTAPEEDAKLLLALKMPCVACGKSIHPIRSRNKKLGTGLYFASSCSQDKSRACSRGNAAREEYDLVEEVLS